MWLEVFVVQQGSVGFVTDLILFLNEEEERLLNQCMSTTNVAWQIGPGLSNGAIHMVVPGLEKGKISRARVDMHGNIGPDQKEGVPLHEAVLRGDPIGPESNDMHGNGKRERKVTKRMGTPTSTKNQQTKIPPDDKEHQHQKQHHLMTRTV